MADTLSLKWFWCPYCMIKHQANAKTRRFDDVDHLVICKDDACRKIHRKVMDLRTKRRQRACSVERHTRFKPLPARVKSPERFTREQSVDGLVNCKIIEDPDAGPWDDGE